MACRSLRASTGAALYLPETLRIAGLAIHHSSAPNFDDSALSPEPFRTDCRGRQSRVEEQVRGGTDKGVRPADECTCGR